MTSDPILVEMRFPGEGITDAEKQTDAPLEITVRDLGEGRYRIEDFLVVQFELDCVRFMDIVTAEQLDDDTLLFTGVVEPGNWQCDTWSVPPEFWHSDEMKPIVDRMAEAGILWQAHGLMGGLYLTMSPPNCRYDPEPDINEAMKRWREDGGTSKHD